MPVPQSLNESTLEKSRSRAGERPAPCVVDVELCRDVAISIGINSLVLACWLGKSVLPFLLSMTVCLLLSHHCVSFLAILEAADSSGPMVHIVSCLLQIPVAIGELTWSLGRTCRLGVTGRSIRRWVGPSVCIRAYVE